MLKLFILAAPLFAAIRGQHTTACRTTVGDTGTCRPLKQCTPLLNLSKKQMKTPEDIQLLRASSCGFTPDQMPKVCCPLNWDTWTTPRSDPTTKIQIIVSDSFIHKPTEEASDQFKPQITGSEPSCPLTDSLPTDDCCGMEAVGGNRILGGKATAIDEYPWLVLVEYHKNVVYRDKAEKLVETLCAGALISSRYVLSAAHCTKISWGRPTNIRLSEYNTNTTRDCVPTDGGGEECISAHTEPIERFIAHPEYNVSDVNKKNDIALFRMRNRVPYSDFIKPICLPSQDVSRFAQGTKLYVAGWGFNGKAYSSVKLAVGVPYVPLQQCQARYMSTKKIILDDRQVCAGGVEGEDSCIGDSGGPLMYQTASLKYEVVGVVSFGPRRCGSKGLPAIHTNVYRYIDWIKRNI